MESVTQELKMLAKMDKKWMCPNCQHLLDVSNDCGRVINISVDWNECPYAQVFLDHPYVETENDGSGNNRKYVIDGKSIFKTVDNGGGYYIVKCPFFKKVKG